MNVAEIAGIGLQRHGGIDAPAQIAREFDAMLFGLLWRSAKASGAHGSAPVQMFGELFAQQLAAQHSAGFGAMVLRSLDSNKGG